MLALDTQAETRLADAFSTLLAPLDYADADAWRSAVNRQLKPLLGADMVTFLLPLGGEADFFSEEYDAVTAETYQGEIAPVAKRFRFWERCWRHPVGNRPMIWGRHVDAYFRGDYWNEYAKPLRAYDALLVTAPLGDRPVPECAAQLMFHHASPHTPSFGERGLALGRLLLPALKTGAVSFLRLATAREAFVRLVDELDTALLLFGTDGQRLHANRCLGRLLGDDTERALIEAAAGSLVARHILTLRGRGRRSAALRDAACGVRVHTPQAAYALRAVRVGPDVTGYRDAVVVLVENDTERLPTPEALRARHDLTQQQARVALLLAERQTNAEIADALCVSPHTAHRHTTAVLDKLNVHSRRDVRAQMLRGSAKS